MPVVMIMTWEGVKKEDYEALRKTVNWEGNVPQGAMFHVSAFDGKGIRVTDVWENEQDFKKFVDSRLMPEAKKMGLKSEPKVEILPVHAVFAPAYKRAAT
ncbi:hypothetical protein NTE_02932 [Candidatus Nitrososphaera evergladensis SR1]|uniref:ABM domain-containing protein n=1 Tax=Candidatus Nitrososphaera evergladensis SR1 TaxID=1459636 RepID=A0A075MUX7_9ARCH|nr:hypothetical protein [Candidatus Nitrososphaera evergladensis]AIF84968.1 hypothetical protein NTE_02932 [Candidatus Nitrososphaera evergladensis SR1]